MTKAGRKRAYRHLSNIDTAMCMKQQCREASITETGTCSRPAEEVLRDRRSRIRPFPLTGTWQVCLDPTEGWTPREVAPIVGCAWPSPRKNWRQGTERLKSGHLACDWDPHIPQPPLPQDCTTPTPPDATAPQRKEHFSATSSKTKSLFSSLKRRVSGCSV